MIPGWNPTGHSPRIDIPVAIHLGPGPPGVAYIKSPMPRSHPDFRMAIGDPLLLEEVLLHAAAAPLRDARGLAPSRVDACASPLVSQRLRGYRRAALGPHPSRAAYYRYLNSLVEGGFGKRIMFGSDFPDQIEMGIDAIVAAEFLTPEQKNDILCGNAARFLRLDAAICRPWSRPIGAIGLLRNQRDRGACRDCHATPGEDDPVDRLASGRCYIDCYVDGRPACGGASPDSCGPRSCCGGVAFQPRGVGRRSRRCVGDRVGAAFTGGRRRPRSADQLADCTN